MINDVKPTFFLPFIKDCAVATIVVIATQPMIFFKNSLQSNLTSSEWKKNPAILFRGTNSVLAGYIPTVLMQCSLNRSFEKNMHPLAAASLSGILSSVFVCPTELIMNQQQIGGLKFFNTLKMILKISGPWGLFRGVFPTACREGGYAGAYLGAAPLLSRMLQSHGLSEYKADITGGALAGISASAATHPFDTYKTIVQRNLKSSLRLREIILTRQAFKGLAWRMGLVTTGITLLPIIRKEMGC